MVYLTQLVYLHPDKHAAFEAFENVAIPLISKYRGRLLLRLRPDASCVVQAGIEVPYELHVVSFDSEADLNAFTQGPQRQQVLHLKNESVRHSILLTAIADVPIEAQ
jgi:antibiotic biosynthesis monooxygenase (ABM) superfamily enzyme